MIDVIFESFDSTLFSTKHGSSQITVAIPLELNSLFQFIDRRCRRRTACCPPFKVNYVNTDRYIDRKESVQNILADSVF